MPHELVWNINNFDQWRDLRKADEAIKSTALEDSPVYNLGKSASNEKLSIQLKLVSASSGQAFTEDMKLIIFNVSKDFSFEGSFELYFGKFKAHEASLCLRPNYSYTVKSPSKVSLEIESLHRDWL